MGFRSHRRFLASVAVLWLAASIAVFPQDASHRGRKYKAPPPTSRIEVTILRNDDGKPIENAAVVFQLEGDKGNMELKTNEDGKALIDVLPTGSKVLLQVLAKGFQTYGGDYKIDKAQMSIQVKLKRPGQQYSIYDNHPEAAASSHGTDKAKPADATQDPGASKDRPAEAAKESDAKPDTTQPQPQ
jgi:hypothetical protein